MDNQHDGNEQNDEEENEVIIMTSWSVGIAKNKDQWTISFLMKGDRDDGSHLKCQFDIQEPDKIVFINSQLLKLKAIPKDNWKAEDVILNVVNNQLEITMVDTNGAGDNFTEKYQSENVAELQTIISLIKKFKDDIKLLSSQ